MKSIEKALSWYVSKGALPYWSILLLDCLLIIISDFIVHGLMEQSIITRYGFLHALGTFSFYLIFYIIGFKIFHTYSGVIRFSSFIDLRRVGTAIFLGLVLSLIVNSLIGSQTWLIKQSSLSMILEAGLSIILIWSIRIWAKSIFDGLKRNGQVKRVLIYGAKEGAVALAKSINNQKDSPYTVFGFISGDNDHMEGKWLMGKRVLGKDKKLMACIKNMSIKYVMVSPLKSNELRQNVDFTNTLLEHHVGILMMPDAREWDGMSDINYTQLKEVDVEDLLPRDRIDIDMQGIGSLLRGRCVLITGAAGSIGSEIVNQVAQFKPSRMVLIDQAETPLHDIRLFMAGKWREIPADTIVSDITNKERMRAIFELYKPEYVFHAAAYKHVPMMEDNPSESIHNNVNGTRIIADLAVKYGAKKFVMVSTDKAVNPTNVMGCSKRICEIYVQSLDKAVKEGKVKGECRFVTTRFGNVLGSNGSVIPLFKKQLKEGGPLTVTHPDIIRFFMLISEACKLVLEAGTMGTGGEIFVFDMGKPVRIADLAKRMIKLSGAKNVEIKYVGLRDGEKLYEEVLNDKETTLPTFHPKIKIAKVREYDYDEVCKSIDQLIETAKHGDDMEIVKAMKTIVTEFKSQHSKYEVLD